MQLLFANGENGGYWPADPQYSFEDSAGTLAASVNGVVGYRMDVALGKHAVQATTANKPYLRRTPTTDKPWYDSNTATGAMNVTFASAMGRRNLLTYTENFSAWIAGIYDQHARPTVTSNTDIAPDGSLTADTLTCTHVEASTIGNTTPTIAASANQVFTISCWVKSSNISTFRFCIAYGTSGYSFGNHLGYTFSLPITIINSWVRYSFTTQLPNNASITTVHACISFGSATVGTTMQVWGAQLELGSTPTDYQKIVAGPSAVLDPVALTATYPQNISATTNCTIACVTPEGVVIADNQTVRTTFNIAPAFGYNSDVLIINRALTPAEKALVTRVMQRSVPSLGSNLAVNGSFTTDTDWTKGSGWSIDGTAAKSAGTASNLTQTLGVSGNQYRVTADIARTAGTVGAYNGTAQIGATAATETAAKYAMKTTSTTVGFRGDASFAGTVDNAVIQEIL